MRWQEGANLRNHQSAWPTWLTGLVRPLHAGSRYLRNAALLLALSALVSGCNDDGSTKPLFGDPPPPSDSKPKPAKPSPPSPPTPPPPAPQPAGVSTFHNAAPWYDDRGKLIQAHGGGLIQVDDTFYWVGEDKTNKIANATAFFENIPCYSSKDLISWKFVNNILTKQPSGDLGPEHIIERPKIIYNDKTKKYVMYMHVDWKFYENDLSEWAYYTAARVGVATSDTVCGNYTYIRSFRPFDKLSRDMTLFKDSDNSAYLISEERSAGTNIIRLSDDYLDVKETLSTIGGPRQSLQMEAPAIFKRNGKYFAIGSTLSGWYLNNNNYVTAPSLKGPWSAPKVLAKYGTNTLGSQSTYVLPISGKKETTYLYMGDRWTTYLGESPYVWTPLEFDDSNNLKELKWRSIYGIDLGAGSVVPSIKTKHYPTSEATLSGDAKIINCTHCFDTEKTATNIGGGTDGKKGIVTLDKISSLHDEFRTVYIRYFNRTDKVRYATIMTNDVPQIVSLVPTPGRDYGSITTATVKLRAGTNIMKIFGAAFEGNGDTTAPDIDLVYFDGD